MKVLVTGGAGFIGSHVVDKLIEYGYEPVVVDSLVRGKSDYIHPDASFYTTEIGEAEISDVFSVERPDFVIHLAAQISVGQSLVHPTVDASTNITGTINVLQSAAKYGVKKVIYASSAAVYGDPVYLPIDEKHPIQPASFYGLSKHVAERYLEVFARVSGLDYMVLRYANVYGPRQDPAGEAGVVSIFADQLLSGQQPIVFGDGSQSRDFVYVEDVAEANVLALTAGSVDVCNISSGRQTSLLELLATMTRLVGGEVDPLFRDARPGDIVHSVMLNDKAKSVLGWKPATSLEVGLERTIQSLYTIGSTTS